MTLKMTRNDPQYHLHWSEVHETGHKRQQREQDSTFLCRMQHGWFDYVATRSSAALSNSLDMMLSAGKLQGGVVSATTDSDVAASLNLLERTNRAAITDWVDVVMWLPGTDLTAGFGPHRCWQCRGVRLSTSVAGPTSSSTIEATPYVDEMGESDNQNRN